MKKYVAELYPEELKSRIEINPLALVPIGVIEWHGEHLPLGVDGYLSLATCNALAKATGCLIAPPIWYGISRNLSKSNGYAGTLTSIRAETLTALVADLLTGLAEFGFKQAVLLSGHFEPAHYDAINAGMEKAAQIESVFLTEGELIEGLVEATDDVSDTWRFASDHAAEFETSLMLHHHPGLVTMGRAPAHLDLPFPNLPPYILRRYPQRATAEYGRLLHEAIVDAGIRKIRELQNGVV